MDANVRTLTPERQALRQDAIRIRQELGWSQRQIAGHLSLPKSTIDLWLPKNGIAGLPRNNPIALNTVHVMDAVTGMNRLPHESVDLIFADPPYNIGVDYANGASDRLHSYLNTCREWFVAMRRVLKKTGSLYLMHYPEVAAQWVPILDGLGLHYRHWITWHFPTNIGQSNKDWTRSQRTILFYTKGNSYAFNSLADAQPYRNPTDRRIKQLMAEGRDGVTPYDFWQYNLVKNVSREKTGWPNQVPLALVERIVKVSSNPGDLVCDPFMGSGTTAEAATRNNRRWVGFDLSPESPKETERRLGQLQV